MGWGCLGDLTAIGDDDFLGGCARLRADALDFLNDVHAFGHRSEDAMLAIQPVSLDGAQEKLGAVGVRAGVGHRENTGAGVLQLKVLIRELLTIDGLAAGAVTSSEIATLAHELRDDTMKSRRLVPEALLAGAESAKILGGLGDDVGAESHLDAAGGGATDGHVKENDGVGHFD